MMTVRNELAKKSAFEFRPSRIRREKRETYMVGRGVKLRCVNVQKAVEDSVGVCCKREEEKRREAC